MNKPRLRFKGFSDEWKFEKLKNIASIHARIGWQNLRNSEFLDEGSYLLITGTDFDDGVINFKNCHYVEKQRYDQDPNIQVKNGNILITKDGTLGKVAIVKNLKIPATLNAGVFNISPKLINNDYLFQYLKAPFLMNYAKNHATGGTIKHLNQSVLVEFPVPITDILEQNQIGAFFSKLDHLINLQKSKLEHLKQLKKGYLQKMFASNHILRFKHFNDDWKVDILGQLGTIKAGGDVNKTKLLKHGHYPVVANGLSNDGVIGYYNDEYKVDGNTVTITGRGNIGIAKERNYKYTPVVRLLSFETNMDTKFIELAINKIHIFNESTGVPQLTGVQLKNYKIEFPTYPEQQKIGAFFHNLDQQLYRSETKLTHLQSLKQAYLRKMFI